MDAFDLMAKLSLDSSDYDRGLKAAGGKLSSFASKIGGGLATAAKVGTAAMGVAASAVGALTAAAVSGYSEFEQLKGGVEKLYGSAADQLMNYANQAYKTAGMSANQYMEQATSFSASLINSLGGDTKKAAEQTDVAMRAMSDNVNTFGSSMEDVQNAFQGFSKQNYTMLDNLKLGYGGTKEEMQRLIEDANEYGASIGEASDLSIESFSDIVTAIDLIQKKQHIAGTTAKEAATTISGSWGMVKSAWQNLVTGFADGNADIEKLMSNLKDSIFGYVDDSGEKINGLVDNLMPVVSQALVGVGEFISEAIPQLLDTIPKMITDFGPQLLTAAASLLQQIMTAFPGMVNSFVSIVPGLVNAFVSSFKSSFGTVDFSSVVISIVNGIMSSADKLTTVGGKLADKLSKGIESNLPKVIDVGAKVLTKFSDNLLKNANKIIDIGLKLVMSLVRGIMNGLPSLIKAAPKIISNFADYVRQNSSKLVATGVLIIGEIVKGIIKASPTLIKEFPAILKAVVKLIIAFNWISIGYKAITLLLSGMSDKLSDVPKVVKDAASNAINNFRNIGWGNAGAKAVNSIIDKIKNIGGKIKDALKKAGEKAKSAFENISWSSIGTNLINGIANGAVDAAGNLYDTARSIANSVLDTIKATFGIASPAKEGIKIGKFLAKGIAKGIKSGEKDAKKRAKEIADKILNRAQKRLDKYHVYHRSINEKTLAADVAYWNKVRKKIKKGTQARIDADNKYFTARETLQEYYDQKNQAIYDKAEQRLQNIQVYRKTDLKYEERYWNKVRKLIKKGTQARIDADKKYYDAKRARAQAKSEAKSEAKTIAVEYKTKYKEIQKARADAIKEANDEFKKRYKEIEEDLAESIKEINEDLQDQIDSALADYESSVSSRKSDILSQLSLFESVNLDEATNRNDLLSNLEDQVDKLTKWDMTLDQLAGRLGKDNPLLKDLEAMGVSSLNTLNQINGMSDKELEQYTELYNKRAAIAEERAKNENELALQELNQEIEKWKQQAEEQVKAANDLAAQQKAEAKKEWKQTLTDIRTEYNNQILELNKEFKKSLTELAKSVKSQGKDVGKAMAAGISEGLKGSSKVLTKASKTTLNNTIGYIKKILGIKSPSKAFAEVGKMIDMGLAEGITDNIKAVEKSMSELSTSTLGAGVELVDGIASAQSNMQAYKSAAAAASDSIQNNDITLNIYGSENQDVKELADIIQQRLTQNVSVLRRGLQGA